MAKLIQFIFEEGCGTHNVAAVPDDTEMADMLPIMRGFISNHYPDKSYDGLFPNDDGNVQTVEVPNEEYKDVEDIFIVTHLTMVGFEK
jgi:hypothetical protein